jgi:glycosyltransferase involved in cell wall biosynthesis
MNGSQPSVSVIIPTYNRAALIGDAINSCLAQCSPSFTVELLIVDDGSTDATGAALREFEGKIRVIVLATNQGRNRARNVGLSKATGRYVKFLDSDDVLFPGCLRIEVAAADEADADIVVAGWQTMEMDVTGRTNAIARLDPPNMEPVIDSLLAGKAVPTGAALYSRPLVRDLKWDEDLRKLDDWDWFVRAALHARKIVRTRTTSYSWRLHPTQGIRSETMLRNAQEHHAILKKLEEALAERGELTPERQKRLAQYFYKEMRVLSLYDKPGFEWGVRHIYQLDTNFVPWDEERQWWMRIACRFLGVRRALSMHSAAKKCIKRTGR